MRWESILPIRSAIRFMKKMKELDLILLSHGGEEKAVEAERIRNSEIRCCCGARWTMA